MNHGKKMSKAKAKGKARIKFLCNHGATKDEAVTILLAEQYREIDRLNRYLTEAVAAMDQAETDRFFGIV